MWILTKCFFHTVEMSVFRLVKLAFIAKATTNLSLGVTEAGQYNPLLALISQLAILTVYILEPCFQKSWITVKDDLQTLFDRYSNEYSSANTRWLMFKMKNA